MELNEAQINSNYLVWCEKLKIYGCYSDAMMQDMGEILRLATFNRSVEKGGCYQGAMIDVVLNVLCRIGTNLNGVRYTKRGLLNTNQNSLVKVLLLMHISKAELMVVNDNRYSYNKGNYFKWNDDLSTVMKCGERSVYLCQKYGITLTEEEYEAMRILDRSDLDVYPFFNTLSLMVFVANKMTATELLKRYEIDEKPKKQQLEL